MTFLNISLPEPLKTYVEERVGSGDFGTPSEFIRALIRHDKESRNAGIEMQLMDALKSERIDMSVAELNGQGIVDILRRKLSQSK